MERSVSDGNACDSSGYCVNLCGNATWIGGVYVIKQDKSRRGKEGNR